MVLEDFPRLVGKFKKFVIGLSGGQDSVALLHLLKNLAATKVQNSSFSIGSNIQDFKRHIVQQTTKIKDSAIQK